MKKIVLLIFVIQSLLLLSCIKESAELNIFVNCDFPLTYKNKIDSIMNIEHYYELIDLIYHNTRGIKQKFQKTFNVKSNTEYFTNINYGQKKQFDTNFLFTYFNGDSGFVVGNNSIYFTEDNGISFKLVHEKLNSNNIIDVDFINDSIGWIVTVNQIFKTTNGGKDWIKIKEFGDRDYNGKIFALNEKTCWYLGASKLWNTRNGGDNWNKYSFKFGSPCDDFYFVNSDIGWYCCKSRIFRTNNGGKSWEKVFEGGSFSSYQDAKIFFLNEKIGWVFYSDQFYITSDGGINWIVYDIDNIPYEINDIFFINEKVGWAVGRYGKIYTTKNGGKKWVNLFSGITNTSLESVNFLNENYGWVVGYNGIILKTDNGGFSWQPINVELTNTQIKSSRIIIDVELDISYRSISGYGISQNCRVYSPNDIKIPQNQSWDIYYSFDNFSLRDYDPYYDKHKEIYKIIETKLDKSIYAVKRYIKKMN